MKPPTQSPQIADTMNQEDVMEEVLLKTDEKTETKEEYYAEIRRRVANVLAGNVVQHDLIEVEGE